MTDLDALAEELNAHGITSFLPVNPRKLHIDLGFSVAQDGTVYLAGSTCGLTEACWTAIRIIDRHVHPNVSS